MEQKQFYTVKEFAKLVNVSTQTIYKQLETRLNPFIIEVDGHRVIKQEALSTFYSAVANSIQSETTENNADTTEIDNAKQPNTTKVDNSKQPQTTPNNDFTTAIIEMLQNELAIKNQQIEELNKRLAESQNLISQEQQLRALEHKKLLELEESNRQQKEEQEQRAAEETQAAKGKGFNLFGFWRNRKNK